MLEYRIESLLKLKSLLDNSNEEFIALARRAELENPWFTQDFIRLSADNIINAFLDRTTLQAFADRYDYKESPKTIGIVMAGNIPFVGFHDLLCGVLSGHNLRVKVSSKDKVLMTFIINKLKQSHPILKDSIEISDRLNSCDAYIATGSNQSNVYFEQYFGKYPNILRKSRSSVGILTGEENEADLINLGNDVHSYFGLGCRNISKIYVPNNYNFEPLINAFKQFEHLEEFTKYKNNIDYNLSLLLLNQQMYMSTKTILVVENKNTHAPIGVLHYEFYKNLDSVIEQMKNDPEIQAIVGHNFIPFGKAQEPAIDDFADGIDTMAFLTSL